MRIVRPPTIPFTSINKHPHPFAFGCTHREPNQHAYFWLLGSEATSTHELLDSPVAVRLSIDQGEIVHARLEGDEFCDDKPGPPKASKDVLISGEARQPPFAVTVSLWLTLTRATRSSRC